MTIDPGTMYARCGTIPLITIKLKLDLGDEIQHPGAHCLTLNRIRNTSAQPDFVRTFESELSEPRSVVLQSVSLAAFSLVIWLIKNILSVISHIYSL